MRPSRDMLVVWCILVAFGALPLLGLLVSLVGTGRVPTLYTRIETEPGCTRPGFVLIKPHGTPLVCVPGYPAEQVPVDRSRQ